VQLRVFRDVPAHRRNLQAGQRLPRRAERGVVPRVAILPTTVHALRQIERDGRAAAPQLPREVPILHLDALERGLQPLEHLEHDTVNAKYDDDCLSRRAPRTPAAWRRRALAGTMELPSKAKT
jgi:hypothetical protein